MSQPRQSGIATTWASVSAKKPGEVYPAIALPCLAGGQPTSAPAFAELATLIVQVLSDADVLHQRPMTPASQQTCWEDDCVEWHVVLAHKLHQFNILWVLPPMAQAQSRPPKFGRLALQHSMLATE
eukprot:GHRR01023630.1.p1 GENE.GHRR01023630.1~~GHRR01023630.1.p1  ORF type:complete len:126 (+),score=8.31 GHRR01023630.1:898-1275(+)